MRPELRVAWVADAAYPPRSGIGNNAYQLIKGLRELDCPTTVIHFGRRPPLFPGEVREVELPKWMMKRGLRRIAPPFHPAVRRVADIVHFPTEFDLWYLKPAWVRRVVTIHGCAAALMPPRLHHRQSGGLIRRLSRALREVDGIVTVSRSSALEIEQVYGIARELIGIIPNGAGEAFFRAQPLDKMEYRRRYGINGPYALAVGLMLPKKNLNGAMEVVARLNRGGRRLCLVHAGETGPQAEELKDMAGKLGMIDAWMPLGYLPEDELAALYAGAALLIFPSYHEGFGIPVIEAMAAGCPVIASRLPAIAETAGEAAALIDPDDHEGMAREAERLLDDNDYRSRRIEAGRARSASFSWRASAEKLLVYYQGLMAHHQPLRKSFFGLPPGHLGRRDVQDQDAKRR